MDQKELGDSIARQLDSIVDIANWILFLALVFFWAGFSKQDHPINVLGLQVDRSHAFFVACTLYLAANFLLLILFRRIADLLLLVDDENLLVAVTKLITHKWAANPFAFFGDRWGAKLHASCGFALLVLVWSLGNASLYALAGPVFRHTIVFKSSQILFLLMGIACISAWQRALQIILDRLERSSPKLQQDLKVTEAWRWRFAYIGIFLGAVTVLVVNLKQIDAA